MKETIVFCVPGKQFSHHFMRSWTNTIIECYKQQLPFVVQWATGANVYMVRNQCLGGNPANGPDQKPFQGKFKYDYIMWLDSDQVWAPNNFLYLLNIMRKNKNIMALTGVYPRVDDGISNISTIGKMSEDENGLINVRLLNRYEIEDLPAITKIDAAGLGFCMMRVGVLENIKYPWFIPINIIDKRIKLPVYFLSEDFSFFQRLKSEAGIDLFCATKVRIGHEKEKIYQLE